jgi:hypothetical protein
MIVLNQNLSEVDGGRRPTAMSSMTPQQIKNEAAVVMRQGLSSQAWQVLDLLYAGGIMTADQLGMTTRTLRRYANRRIIARYIWSSKNIVHELGEYGLLVENGKLYTLGMVGAEIASTRHGKKPSAEYLAYRFERVLRRVIVNQIILRIAAEGEAHGWDMVWMGKQEARLFRDDDLILEPDAFIRLERGDEEYPLLIEYHHENKRRRAIQKVHDYEYAWESNLWQEAWDVNSFPSVLVVFRNQIMGEGYLDGVKEASPVRCDYYGRLLEGIWEKGGMDSWFHINAQRKGNVFPWLNRDFS